MSVTSHLHATNSVIYSVGNGRVHSVIRVSRGIVDLNLLIIMIESMVLQCEQSSKSTMLIYWLLILDKH